ncbi:MAG: hypothetical protein M1816_008152 [Peltula sp. TS41687]|nr:MAG: hypothetical protein M1816_008152 [Peltula sp. TS41687]
MVDKGSPSFDAGEGQEDLLLPAESKDTTFSPPNVHQANDDEAQALIPQQQTSYDIPSQSWQDTLPDHAAETPESAQAGIAPYQTWPNLDHQVNMNPPQPQLQDPRQHPRLLTGYDGNRAMTDHYQGYGSGDYANMPPTQQFAQGQDQSSPTPGDPESPVARRTRSGRALGQSATTQGKPTVTKPAQGKKAAKAAKASKREKPKAPKIDKPLSELTANYSHVKIKDMDAWVNRSNEVRFREVEKRNGHVARPMNSFMLYRSAYAERTKVWCLQNNHQVVSSVSGESWPMETPEIREKYEKLAKQERENHQNAHPGYKFSPSKSINAKKRKTLITEFDESELSDGDDEDSWSEKGSRGKRSKSNRRTVKNAGKLDNNLPYPGLRTRPQNLGGGPLVPSYPATYSGVPGPNVMEPHGVYGQHYQAPMHPNMNNPYVGEVAMQRTDTPSSHPNAYHALVGLPGTLNQDLYHGSSANTPAPEHSVDPTLVDPMSNFTNNPTSANVGHGNALSYNPYPAPYDTQQGGGAPYGNLNPSYFLDSSLGEHHNLETNEFYAPEYREDGDDQWQPKEDVGQEYKGWHDQDR